VYLAREELSEFWSVFAHVVRNGVSHGLEPPEARAHRGTPSSNDFELRAGVQNGSLFVEIEDHGPGIDWETIRLRARQLRLPADTHPDLVAALFADGISTNSEVDAWSGRGVGLSAVREACLRQRGKIDVDTVLGAGTKFRFSWPASQFTSLVEFNAGGAT
jgi:two-component system, chemotaxis family, sensor kinase CheA